MALRSLLLCSSKLGVALALIALNLLQMFVLK
jgi:hypothetical protein